jgi:5-formyltetrahydrofolate cyclo-ligase
MQTKRALREHFREVRASMDADERVRADTAIALTLWGTEEYQNAGIIFSYVSFGQDVDTIATFVKAWEDGKRVAVPIFHPATHSMEFFEVNSIQDLHGTAELDNPGAGRLTASPDDICIVPGLGYDVQGHRLGTGGGYFDRFLSTFPGKAVGLCHDVQVTEDELPQGDHDIPVALLVTEKRVLRRA